MRDHAARNGAVVAVILAPTVRDMSGLQEDFDGVAEMFTGLNVSVIDLIGTFADVVDLDECRVSPDNVHSNAAGHRRFSAKLYERVLADPQLEQIVLGSSMLNADRW